MSDYNLIDEKWIPVLYHNGKYDRLGIRQSLEDSHKIRQIAASNPMDRVAIIRFLLTVLYWCKGNPSTDGELLPDKFSNEWFDKLEKHRECFNLLGEGKRFYQFGGYDKKSDNLKSVNYLYHEVPTATNIAHFIHSKDKEDGLCPACSAIGLLRLTIFISSGGQGLSPGINSIPPVYILPFGNSLAETLWLSYKKIQSLGSPIWEDNTIDSNETGEFPLLNGLTALPRQVWLIQSDKYASCIICGKSEQIIFECVFTNRFVKDKNTQWEDPHVVYIKQKQGKKSLLADRPLNIWFKTDRPWTKLIKNSLESGKFPKQNYLVIGTATDDKAKFFDTWERTITLPKMENSESLMKFIDKWDDSVNKLSSLIKDKKRKRNILERTILKHISPQAENEISSDLSSLLNNELDPWTDATNQYKKLMIPLAKSIAPGHTISQVQRRNCISEIYPTKEKLSDSKAKTKNGGKVK